jgi:hypothetical protein
MIGGCRARGGGHRRDVCIQPVLVRRSRSKQTMVSRGGWVGGSWVVVLNLFTRPFHRSEITRFAPLSGRLVFAGLVWSLCDRTSMVVGRRPFPSLSILGRALLLMSSSPAHTLATIKAPRFPRDSNALTALRAWATADNNDRPSQIVDVRVCRNAITQSMLMTVCPN